MSSEHANDGSVDSSWLNPRGYGRVLVRARPGTVLVSHRRLLGLVDSVRMFTPDAAAITRGGVTAPPRVTPTAVEIGATFVGPPTRHGITATGNEFEVSKPSQADRVSGPAEPSRPLRHQNACVRWSGVQTRANPA